MDFYLLICIAKLCFIKPILVITTKFYEKYSYNEL